ncbi:hypothetical protein H6G17_24210 [Chroococcidiopsis sp. FACHB-1243]|uniref:hypothetical protein n=1 Tax=Chroococcidiopsis sp. [FACHB-1243] TaxID=2692781 RepID=UPI0017835651|nr:hypothetical protein [Chroococcidiopsis sp. [FACHB-1243]]MBD2308578.1 hypothetical protein [Chroococcidiopsis sp. [FACHB-1243]]
MVKPIVNTRFEFRCSETFIHQLDYLAIRYTNGKRSQLIRDCVEQLYSDTLATSAITSETTKGVQDG